MKLHKNTIVDLLRLNGITDKITKVVPTTFYGYLYDNTFGSQEATLEDIEKVIRKLKPKKVLELMGGNGFESYLLSQKFPTIDFTYLDIRKYKNNYLTNNCKFVRESCLADKIIGKFDLIFVGTTNASVSEFTNIEQLKNLQKFCYNNLTSNGECFLGINIGSISDIKVELDYSVDVTFENKEVRWGNLIVRDLVEVIEKYYLFWIEDTTLHYSLLPYTYKIWSLDVLRIIFGSSFLFKNIGDRFAHLKRKV